MQRGTPPAPRLRPGIGVSAAVFPTYRMPCQTTARPQPGRGVGPGEARFDAEPQPRHRKTRQVAVRIRAMADESIRVTRSVSIPRSEIELRFSRSSGPGGQHAQKSDTRVEAVFDVEASSTLSEAQKRRVLAKAGPVLRAVAQDERSQWRNRELALERLAETLREALRVQRRRRATKPSKVAFERRLEGKHRRSKTTRLRRPPE
jgi:ribosome-associated protein